MTGAASAQECLRSHRPRAGTGRPGGLAPIVIDEVYRKLRAVRDAGTTLLIVEQYVGHALQIADEVAVLTKGTGRFQGADDDLGDLSQWLLPSSVTSRRGARGRPFVSGDQEPSASRRPRPRDQRGVGRRPGPGRRTARRG